MKTIILILMAGSAYCQPYLTIGGTHKGLSIGGGVVASGVDVSAKYDRHLSRADKPAIASLTIGKQFKTETGTYTLTPLAGAGYAAYKDFTNYDASNGKVVQVRKAIPVFGVEAGWNQHVGRISLTARYMDGMYYGVSMRAFLK